MSKAEGETCSNQVSFRPNASEALDEVKNRARIARMIEESYELNPLLNPAFPIFQVLEPSFLPFFQEEWQIEDSDQADRLARFLSGWLNHIPNHEHQLYHLNDDQRTRLISAAVKFSPDTLDDPKFLGKTLEFQLVESHRQSRILYKQLEDLGCNINSIEITPETLYAWSAFEQFDSPTGQLKKFPLYDIDREILSKMNDSDPMIANYKKILENEPSALANPQARFRWSAEKWFIHPQFSFPSMMTTSVEANGTSWTQEDIGKINLELFKIQGRLKMHQVILAGDTDLSAYHLDDRLNALGEIKIQP